MTLKPSRDLPLDELHISDLQVSCIVGVYPRERNEHQPLKVDIRMFLDTRAAASQHGLKYTVDYAKVSGEVRFLLESCHFGTLETAADALARYLLSTGLTGHSEQCVHEVEICLTKPNALAGAVPSIKIRRVRGEFSYEEETQDFGQVDIIFSSESCGIYRLRLNPGSSIPAHVHRQMDESELVLGDGLLLQGQPVAAGMAFRWKRDFAHRYDNPTENVQSILCVDRPSFIEADEIRIDVPLEELVQVEGSSYYPKI